MPVSLWWYTCYIWVMCESWLDFRPFALLHNKVSQCPLEGRCLMMPVSDQASNSWRSDRIQGERPAERNSWEATVMPSAADSHFRWVLALFVCVWVCVCLQHEHLQTGGCVWMWSCRSNIFFYTLFFYTLRGNLSVNFACCTEDMRSKGTQSLTLPCALRQSKANSRIFFFWNTQHTDLSYNSHM